MRTANEPDHSTFRGQPAESHRAERQLSAGPAKSEPFAPQWTGGIVSEQKFPSHPAFERLLARMPVQVRATLTTEQLMALSLASVPAIAPHIVDYRVSIPFLGKRFYLTVLAGRERRSLARLAGEGQLPSVKLAKLNATTVGYGLAIALFAAMIALLLAKLALGIELFEGGADAHAVLRALDQPPKF